MPLEGDALVAIEHSRRDQPFTIQTKRLRTTRRAEYGEVAMTFFEVARDRETAYEDAHADR